MIKIEKIEKQVKFIADELGFEELENGDYIHEEAFQKWSSRTKMIEDTLRALIKYLGLELKYVHSTPSKWKVQKKSKKKLDIDNMVG